jgi:hypothetical protein
VTVPAPETLPGPPPRPRLPGVVHLSDDDGLSDDLLGRSQAGPERGSCGATGQALADDLQKLLTGLLLALVDDLGGLCPLTLHGVLGDDLGALDASVDAPRAQSGEKRGLYLVNVLGEHPLRDGTGLLIGTR